MGAIIRPAFMGSIIRPRINKTNLIGWWSMDEANGNRADSHTNGLTLTDNNTVASTTGKVSNAADFERGTSEFFERSNESLIQTGDIDFTIGGWVQLESKPVGGVMMIASREESATNREFIFYWFDTTDRFIFSIFDTGGSAVGGVSADTFGVPSLATWYFVVAWHDATANTVNIQVNNGTVDSAATTGVITAKTNSLRLGARRTSEIDFWDGLMDEMFFFKRVLTADERTLLYNSGNGRAYSEL